ncbi:uncharacterized protein LOC141628660 [Silene latifolia]|uniref:uncharacterized protein LOC141628660 n=1 Tax=Silene latifolia TaxID=37657 RepID=UPI003D77D4C2
MHSIGAGHRLDLEGIPPRGAIEPGGLGTPLQRGGDGIQDPKIGMRNPERTFLRRNLGTGSLLEQQYQELRDLMYRIPGVARPLEKVTRDSYADSPFVDDIALVGVPKGCVPPAMTLYDGTTDPLDHINHYKQKMMVITATGSLKEACMCKGFGSTLSGAALQWFNREKVAIPRCDIATAIEAFRQESDLYKDLTKYPCTTFEEVQTKAIAVMRLEEDSGPRRAAYGTDSTSRKAPVEKQNERAKPYSKPVNKVSEGPGGKNNSEPPPKISEYKFSTNLAGVLKALKEIRGVRWPRKRTDERPNDKRDSSKRCEYHDDIGHDTDECYTLRKEVKFQYDRGNLDHLLPGGSTKVHSTNQVMGFSEKDLATKEVPLVGFSGETKHSLGEIVIPTYAKGVNKQVRYLVIDGPSTYNVILGRPWIHEMKAVPSTYHQCLKFPTPWGVQEIRGDQEEAKNCYKIALKPTARPPA